LDDHTQYRRPTVEPVLEEESDREQIRVFAEFIARLLDSAFCIPGTRIRIGLDPLLGLVPGIGDIIANLIGSSILFFAVQLHVPKIVLARMALNLGINTVYFPFGFEATKSMHNCCAAIPPKPQPAQLPAIGFL